MKPESTTRAAQDRLATWEEIRRATSSTPDRVLELCYSKGTHCEIDSEWGGVVRYPAEEFEFFAYLSETSPSPLN
jgi:hypothetical protein